MAIRIGCDPEFAVIDNHDAYTRFTYRKNLDCGFVKDDHCGAVGELNPNSSTNPSEVVENLRTLIKAIKLEYPNLRVIGGGGAKYRISTGGHIHLSGITNLDFSGYENYSWHRRSTRNHIRPVTKGNKLVLTLDAFIARPLQRLQNGKRADKAYNLLSKIKIKTYSNGLNGFEYRSAPSWLTSPKVAEAVLSTAYKIADIIENDPNAFDQFLGIGVENARTKKTARSRDYNFILAKCGPTEAHLKAQIQNFKDIVADRTFDLADVNATEYWTASTPQPTPQQVVAAGRSRIIPLVPCQLKMIEKSDIVIETTLKVCKFALPEVKIHPIKNHWIPWDFRLRRDVRLRPNTIYFTKDLKPYIKMSRNANFKMRFVDFDSRTANISASIFFNSVACENDAIEFLVDLFSHNVRTKLRKKDLVNG